MKKIVFIFIFFCILCIATFLRIWHLGGVPVSPNWDEAALGYNAYSILKTGRDEYGVFLPFVLKSFGDYKPALYSYITIPFILIFHLSVFSTRLPSALMGIIAVVGTFFLTYELLSLENKNTKRNIILSFLAMFLLAISPWHIQFSRVAFEANIALTLCILGLLFFLLGLKKPLWFIASTICYGLSINAYHSPKLFVPLFLIGLCIIFQKKLLEQKKHLLIPLIICCIFIIPFAYSFLRGQSSQIIGRFSETSVFKNITPLVPTENKNILNTANFYLFDSPLPQKTYQIFTGYFTHFSPSWLFITGDNDRHHAPSTGLLYIWEAPFLLIGLFRILLAKGKFRSIFLLWILLVPIPASLTTELPHAVRTLIFLPSFQIASALGIETYFLWIKKLSIVKSTAIVIPTMIVILFLTFQYFHLYFFQMNHEFSYVWQFGYEHAVNYVEQNREKYKRVVVSTKLEQPYIFFLFYLHFDPKRYLKTGGTKLGEEEAFDIFSFRKINWTQENHDHTTLYILSPDEVPSTNPVHIIRYFDSAPAIVFAE